MSKEEKEKAKLLEEYLQINFKGLKLSLEQRKLLKHHKKSEEMVRAIKTIDEICFSKLNLNQESCETLLCTLDLYFEAKDRSDEDYIRNLRGREYR